MTAEPKTEVETTVFANPISMETAPAEKPTEASAEVETKHLANPSTNDAIPTEKPKDASLEVETAQLVKPNIQEANPTEQPEEESSEVADSVDEDEEEDTRTPLSKLFSALPRIILEADQREIWGVLLSDYNHVPTTIVLQKFLRANNDDASKAQSQLLQALKWRKEMDPLNLLLEVEHNKEKFGNLGFVTTHQACEHVTKEIITWNIYGAVKDIKGTFENLDEFIKWRTALMELSVRELDLANATEIIPDDGPDVYRMIQVHDYLNISFFRMDPAIRAASKAAIQTFAMAYPELVEKKFFVNVPLAMSWVFAALRLFLSREMIKKFHPLSYGANLAKEMGCIGEQLPEVYGGNGLPLAESGLVVKYAAVKESEAQQ